MAYGINYRKVVDPDDFEQRYTIKQSISPTTGETIARATINGHAFEARHIKPQRATALLCETIEDAELRGDTQLPPK